MALNPRIFSNANSLYLEWDADPAADCYRMVAPDGSIHQVGKAQTVVKLGQPTQPFTVSVASAVAQAAETLTYPVAPPPPPPPPPTGMPKYGISTGAEIVVNSAVDRNRELDAIHAIGAQMVRFDHWGDTKSEAVADACFARGMLPMMTLFGTDKSPRTNPGQLAGDVANRCKGKWPTRIYEICNEPDLNGWTPAVYAPFAKAAADQILAADPAAIIWCGGFFKGNDQAGKTPPDFARALVQYAVKFHAFSGHFFDDDPNWNDPRNGWKYAATVRQILDAAGLQNIKILSSETHCGGSDTQQAQAVQSRLQNVKDGKVAATCFYRMRPQGDRPDFALLRADWSERPACSTFRQFVQANP